MANKPSVGTDGTRPSSTDAEDDYPSFDIKTIADQTGFTYKLVESLNERFNELIESHTKSDFDDKILTPDDMYSVSEFKKNPMSKRIAQVFFSYSKDKERMSFEEFVTILAKFRSCHKFDKQTKKEKISEKLDFLFKIYDIDDNQQIDQKDAFTTLKACLSGGTLTDEAIMDLSKQMITEMDRDRDGFISKDDYYQTLNNTDIDSKFNLPFLNRKI